MLADSRFHNINIKKQKNVTIKNSKKQRKNCKTSK